MYFCAESRCIALIRELRMCARKKLLLFSRFLSVLATGGAFSYGATSSMLGQDISAEEKPPFSFGLGKGAPAIRQDRKVKHRG